METGNWQRNRQGYVFLMDQEAAVSFPPTHTRALSLSDVNDARIDKPVQAALMRMSRKAATAAAAASLLELIRQRRIVAIRCMNSADADRRAQRLGSSA